MMEWPPSNGANERAKFPPLIAIILMPIAFFPSTPAAVSIAGDDDLDDDGKKNRDDGGADDE